MLARLLESNPFTVQSSRNCAGSVDTFRMDRVLAAHSLEHPYARSRLDHVGRLLWRDPAQRRLATVQPPDSAPMTRNSTVLLMALTVAADFAQRLKTVACNCLAVRLRGCLRSTRRGTDCLYAAACDLPAPNRALRDIEAPSSALYCLSVPWTFSRDGLHRESQEVRNPDLSDAALIWFPRRETRRSTTA